MKFEDAELEALLDQDSFQTEEELAETLEVIQQAIANNLKVIGMVQGNWVPYDSSQETSDAVFHMRTTAPKTKSEWFFFQ